MKKLYSILFAVFALTIIGSAQCTITSTTVTPTGLNVSANMAATGASIPGYGWSWGDAATSTTQAATHTYASAGTYTVCAVYVDLANSSCFDSTCQVITVTATGINDPMNPNAEISTVPNPFVNTMNVSFALYKSDNVYISVMDVTGKEVAVLQNGNMSAGDHVITWDPANLDAGVYFLQVKSGTAVHTRKVIYTGGK
jgi:hypothetical protein